MKSVDDLVNEARVGGIEQPIEALAMPSNAEIHSGSQPFADPKQRSELHVVDLAGFDLCARLR